MKNDLPDEKFLLWRDRLLCHVRLWINHAGQFWRVEKFLPNLTVIRGDGEEIGNPPRFGFRTKRDNREAQPADDAERTEKIEPIFSKPLCHALILT